jgi:pentatricopeptide repeat protein
MPPKLDQVTLCCIDTDHPALGLRAIRLSQAQCQFARSVFMAPQDFISSQGAPSDPIDFLPIPAFTAAADYSRILTKELLSVFSTSHALVIEWDGYVLSGPCWEKGFLEFDYIGAVWPNGREGFRVGNGGFSLRSRRLLQILARPEIPCSVPDDRAIGVTLRPMLEKEGIRFADEATAHRFSFESGGLDQPTFGFHGAFNFCRVLPSDELQSVLEPLTPRVMSSAPAAHWIKGYAARGRWREALMVLRKMESLFDEPRVLEILSEIADHDIEKAKGARHVIHLKGMKQ